MLKEKKFIKMINPVPNDELMYIYIKEAILICIPLVQDYEDSLLKIEYALTLNFENKGYTLSEIMYQILDDPIIEKSNKILMSINMNGYRELGT